jgi:hypothetical protein
MRDDTAARLRLWFGAWMKILLSIGFPAALCTALSVPAAVAQANNQAQNKSISEASHAGTENWLRKQIAGWEKHQPVFEGMTEALAAGTREQQTAIQAKFDALGAMQSLTFKGQEDGMDVYLVIFDHGALSWMVGPGAKVGSSLFGGPTIRSGPSPGTEAAVRALIRGYAGGFPTYQIMSPSLLQAVLPQQSSLVGAEKELGGLKTLTFSKINARWWDVYEAVYENGHAVWSIAPLSGDKVGSFLISEQTLNASTPHPNREASLRRYVESLERGVPNYDEMPPEGVAAIRRNLPNILAAIRPLGQLRSIAFDHSAPNDTDVYLVTFERGKAEWDMGPLSPDGKVTRRNFRVL